MQISKTNNDKVQHNTHTCTKHLQTTKHFQGQWFGFYWSRSL